MNLERNAAFAAWMEAEATAYGAVHMLHQRTHGGRLEASSEELEHLAQLRNIANTRFADVHHAANGVAQGAAGVSRTIAHALPVSRRRGAVAHLARRSAPASEQMSDICLDNHVASPSRHAAAA